MSIWSSFDLPWFFSQHEENENNLQIKKKKNCIVGQTSVIAARMAGSKSPSTASGENRVRRSEGFDTLFRKLAYTASVVSGEINQATGIGISSAHNKRT
jgi:hypothetical protein